MISIFIMYSGDRAKPLVYTIDFLRKMPQYKSCQKTILYDTKIDFVPDGWTPILIPRVNNEFCWASMWDAGVASARNDIVWHLDSDRMLPSNYIDVMLPYCQDGTFVFSSMHFTMLEEMEFDDCVKFVNGGDPTEWLLGEKGYVRYEPRFKDIIHGPGKNSMSGNTAFTKSTYYRLGGVDRWYRGHGAFADTDFHTTAHLFNCEFIDTKLTELHYFHEKKQDDRSLSEVELRKLSLDNYIYYCHKWGLSRDLPESLAYESGLDKPIKYVAKRWKELDVSPRD